MVGGYLGGYPCPTPKDIEIKHLEREKKIIFEIESKTGKREYLSNIRESVSKGVSWAADYEYAARFPKFKMAAKIGVRNRGVKVP